MDTIVLWVIIPFHAPLCNPETTADPGDFILLAQLIIFSSETKLIRSMGVLGIGEKNLGEFIFVPGT